MLWMEEKNYISECPIVPMKSVSTCFLFVFIHTLEKTAETPFQGHLQTSLEARESVSLPIRRQVCFQISKKIMSSSWAGLLAIP